MEMAIGNKFVTKHVVNIPTWQFNIPPYYKPLEEWEETLEELAWNDDHCLPELLNQIKKELRKVT